MRSYIGASSKKEGPKSKEKTDLLPTSQSVGQSESPNARCHSKNKFIGNGGVGEPQLPSEFDDLEGVMNFGSEAIA